jgi:hypothetical protein
VSPAEIAVVVGAVAAGLGALGKLGSARHSAGELIAVLALVLGVALAGSGAAVLALAGWLR